MTLWPFLEKKKAIKFSVIQLLTRKSVEERYILQVKQHEAEATCLLGPLPFVSFKFIDLVAKQHPSKQAAQNDEAVLTLGGIEGGRLMGMKLGSSSSRRSP